MNSAYQPIQVRARACLAKLEEYATEVGTLALHDPVYAILQAVESGDLSELATQARQLAKAVDSAHPAAAPCRALLGDLSEMGLWSPRAEDSPLEAAIRGIGVDPEDPYAGERLQRWLDRQDRQRMFLEEKTDELRIQLRRTERFSSATVGIAVLLGLLLVVSLLAGGLGSGDDAQESSEVSEEVGR